MAEEMEETMDKGETVDSKSTEAVDLGTQVEKDTQVEKSGEARLSELSAQVEKAVACYRSLLLATAPDVPQELVKGETVEEVEASFEAARDMVERIRQKLEAQVAGERVPAGAPPRSAPDLSTLSPKEKILYGLSRGR